jgi:hypothetical protein
MKRVRSRARMSLGLLWQRPEQTNVASQLKSFIIDYPHKTSPPTISKIKEYMSSLNWAKEELLEEVCKVLKLVLVIPATNASNERPFNALRTKNFYLRATANKGRLNHLTILRSHKELTDLYMLEYHTYLPAYSNNKASLHLGIYLHATQGIFDEIIA